MISQGNDGYYHPANEGEIAELVKYAVTNKLIVRVRGSAHSVPAAIYTDDFKAPPPDAKNINILLDRMMNVSFDYEKKQVTVEAGCHVGRDPYDPSRTSTLENSLYYQLERKRWALPDTGGIAHQTISGFISTGSSGSSLHNAVGRQIVSIRLVDGEGNIREFHKTDNLDDPFYGVVVSMGLLGVITKVTFQCVDRFDITGMETTSSYRNAMIDLFGEGGQGKPTLDEFFRQKEHARLIWFPQRGVRKVIIWEAKKLWERPPDFKLKRYHQFPLFLGSEYPTQLIASLLFRLYDVVNPPEPKSSVAKALRSILRPLYAPIVNSFLASAVLGPQRFTETWWEGLPMDNRTNFRLLPVLFTEMWFPLEKAPEVMREMRAHFEEDGFNTTGTFTCEVYPTPINHFWMSPAYQRDVIKVDPYWFGANRGDPAQVYFPKMWERMKKVGYRLHWGKYLSGDVEYLRQQYPRWDDFMKLRAQMDPHQVFVSDYWRKHLGIPPASA